MKKFSFSLDRVLDFKNQMLDREKNELARMRREHERLEEQLAECIARFERYNQERQEKSKRGVTAFELQSYQFQLDSLRGEMRALRDEMARSQQKIDAQLKKVLAASQDVSGLDKLKDKQLEEFGRYEAKVQETEVAEYVAGKLLVEGQR